MNIVGPVDMIKLVHLEEDTGEVLVANKIDHEIYPWLNLTVKATDSGIPPRSSLVDLFIQVISFYIYLKIKTELCIEILF